MELVLSRSVVRSFRRRDAASLAEQIRSTNVAHEISLIPRPCSLTQAEEWIDLAENQTPERNFGIEIDGRIVGGIAFELKDELRTGVGRFDAELGYWLAERYWGRGVMTEVVRETVEWAFDAVDLVRISALVLAGNFASIRVLEKAGFEYEGRMKAAYFKDGEFVDSLIYAKVKAR